MKAPCVVLLALPLLGLAQKAGTLKEENHPPLTIETCTKAGGCTSQSKSVVIDANWRWIHNGQGQNCYTGTEWNTQYCPDPKTCAENCAVDGAGDYLSTYGISSSGSELTLGYVTGTNVGSRVFLLDDEETYYMFRLKNKEFTFDVDTSQLPCGLNGALYFVQMDKDGGMSKYPGNKAGAKFGTGNCDAQCRHDIKFINGEANTLDWKVEYNLGVGRYGACCLEMDIWEANSLSTALTPHSCNISGHYRCENDACGSTAETRFDGVCDRNGCDFQTYRLGNKTFYGAGPDFAVNSLEKITVVTQFLTVDGTDNGTLSEIRRFYVQGGKSIALPSIAVGGKEYNSITEEYCAAEVGEFKDGTNFLQKGGFKALDNAFAEGVVLIMSLWDDDEADLQWLDGKSGDGAGSLRGPCDPNGGKPADVRREHPNSPVKFSNIKFGEIGSTVSLNETTPTVVV